MNKDTLNELGSKQQYVFHGTGTIIEEFEPRQAYNKNIPDGKPAVWATPVLNYAIFNALFNKINCPRGYTARVNKLNSDNLTYEATKESLDQINENTKGCIYVFNRSDFEQKNMSEWISYKKVKPIKMFEISRKDFPLPIKEFVD